MPRKSPWGATFRMFALRREGAGFGMRRPTQPPIWIDAIERRLDDPFITVDAVRFRLLKSAATDEWTEPQTHLVLDRRDSVAAIVQEESTGLLHLVRQMRIPTFDREQRREDNGWLTELAAGVLVDNETPREGVIREIAEETGFRTIVSAKLIGSFYLSPGASRERLYLFHVVVTSHNRDMSIVRGIDGERIETVPLTATEFLQQVESMEIIDAKTIAAAEYIRRKPEIFGA